MTQLRDILYSSNHRQAHGFCLELEQQSKASDELYYAFPLFLEMLDSPNAFVRVRGFRLLCAQAKWDTDCLIEKNISRILNALEDEKPTNLRQFLSVLPGLIQSKPHLIPGVLEKVRSLPLGRCSGSMQPLLRRDIQDFLSKTENA